VISRTASAPIIALNRSWISRLTPKGRLIAGHLPSFSQPFRCGVRGRGNGSRAARTNSTDFLLEKKGNIKALRRLWNLGSEFSFILVSYHGGLECCEWVGCMESDQLIEFHFVNFTTLFETRQTLMDHNLAFQIF